jgi:hypothetical protein
VFGGGTALSRAYKLTKRMSEDVDLKIVSDKPPSRGALRKFRNDVTDALLAAGFEFDPENEAHRLSMWKGHYTKYQLPYKAEAEGKGPPSRSKPPSGRCGARRSISLWLRLSPKPMGARRKCLPSPVLPFWRLPPRSWWR